MRLTAWLFLLLLASFSLHVECRQDMLLSSGAPRVKQPYELLGYFEGACFHKAAEGKEREGKPIVQCLPEGQTFTQPLAVLYSADKAGHVTFSWWETEAVIRPAGGSEFRMSGGQDSSLQLAAWRTHKEHHSDRPSMCINATFATFTATYRASVIRVGETDVYEEYAEYAIPTLELQHTCPEHANLPLYCNQSTFNYRCVANKVATPPQHILKWLQQHRHTIHPQEAAA